MQRICNGLLYDTDNSTIVYVEPNTNRRLYKTQNGNFFMLYSNGEIIPKNEDSVKYYLGTYDVKKYIELFGEPEEA